MTVPLHASQPTQAPPIESNSLRNLLLANIAHQTELTDQLFSTLSHAALPHPSSRHTRPSRARPDFEAIPSLYDNLLEATEEQAQLLEHARRHQKRWRRLQWKRQQVQEMEDRVRGILIELDRGGNELEELVEQGKQVVAKIEIAERANFSTEDLISYAQNLATTTSRPASLAPPAPLLSAEMLYPVESVMQSGKLAALARGEVVGILGDTQVIGADRDQPGPHVGQSAAQLEKSAEPRSVPPIPASTQGAAVVPPPQDPVQPVVRAPFKLDLSDSEDDD
ncbi:hypothetical protein NCC49_002232 [Naganishia albida]|nr:hypothetical protein NCC49_002232 [Naganishia albida]